MSMNHKLTPIQIKKICSLSDEKRRLLGFVGDIPIANDILTVIDNLNIYLLELPIESNDSHHAFSAALIYSKLEDVEYSFIGLNTADYYDKQIFAIAHELYHYFTKTPSHLCRLFSEQEPKVESEANRFAAEFLLPEKTLKDIIINEYNSQTLTSLEISTLIRFIARLYCNWWLPYRSIVKRLKEINLINEEQYGELYNFDERNENGTFAQICNAINKNIYSILNKPTNRTGTSPKHIEIIIRNYEDNIISEEKLVSALKLFNKTPEEFNLDIGPNEDDTEDFEQYFE